MQDLNTIATSVCEGLVSDLHSVMRSQPVSEPSTRNHEVGQQMFP